MMRMVSPPSLVFIHEDGGAAAQLMEFLLGAVVQFRFGLFRGLVVLHQGAKAQLTHMVKTRDGGETIRIIKTLAVKGIPCLATPGVGDGRALLAVSAGAARTRPWRGGVKNSFHTDMKLKIVTVIMAG